MAIYMIGIGGTGAKCVEAVAKLAAVGLLDEPIKILFIDADETNGNLERARNSLNTYSKCYELMAGWDKEKCPWMKNRIESFDLWSPFTGENSSKELQAFFNYNTMKQNQSALGNIFDVLYTKDEQVVALDVGFRGRPAMGSAVMSKVDLDKFDQEPWGGFIQQIKEDVSGGGAKAPKVFLCGSMFGGTGASGLPTIARLITNELKRKNVKEPIKIGCLFLLPYFGFSSPPGEDPDGIYARSEQFLLNTEAALRYYTTQAKETFDTVFLLGNENFSRVEFSVGKKSQCNNPHFLELYAALAVRHFLSQTDAVTKKVVLMTRKEMGKLTWDDLPEHLTVKSALVNGTRFAYTWLAEIKPELDEVLKRKNDKMALAPWLRQFFPRNLRGQGDGVTQLSDPQQQEIIKAISNWCQDYLSWLYNLHQCEGEQIQLFDTTAMGNPQNNLRQEKLAELVFGSNLDARSKAGDTILVLKRKLQDYKLDTLAEPGILGLAQALYISCKQ